VFRALLESQWVRLPLVAFVALALQTSAMAELRIFGVAPDLVLLLAVAGGLVAGPERGAPAAFVLGLAFDLVLQTPFGLSALAYSVAAFAIGYVQLSVLRAGRIFPMLAVAGASALAVVVYALAGIVFGLQRVIGVQLLPVLLVVPLVNGLLAPVALPVMRWVLLAGDRQRL
jgi:rod shape-determining protein MreD